MLHEAFHQVSAQEVWKQISVEEFQNGCLVLGNL